MTFVGVWTQNRTLAERCRRWVERGGESASVDLGPLGSLIMAVRGTNSSLSEGSVLACSQGPLTADATNNLFSQLGPDFMSEGDEHLAAALWDSSTRRLHLYRGRTGIPPLFYWKTGEGLAWATTLRALLELGAPREIDHLALAEYQLSGFVQAPLTMVAAIRKLPAFHRLSWHPGDEEIKPYWKPEWEPRYERSLEQQKDDVEGLLVSSVEDAIPETNRLGILLSGGIDSVCLAAVASQKTTADITAFTFDYSDYKGKFNEAERARDIADRLEIDHEVIPITSGYVIDRFPRLVAQYEEPFSYGAHSARLAPIWDSGVNVAITGAVGAMWTLSGAPNVATKLHHRLPGWFLSAGTSVADRLPPWGRKLQTGMRLANMSDARRYLALSLQSVLPDAHLEMLWNRPETVHEARSRMVEDLERATPGVAIDNRFAAMGLMAFGAEHLAWWSHRWGEGEGVSLRFPYMEKEYVDYLGALANRQPDKLERRLITAKYLPRDIAYAPKTPQTLPIDVWLAGPLYEFARETLSRETVTDDGTFDFDVLERRLKEHKAGHANHKWSIWTVLCYLIWKREFLEAVPVTR